MLLSIAFYLQYDLFTKQHKASPVSNDLQTNRFLAIEENKLIQNQNKYTIHTPEYSGVEQLLLLSSRWVIVVTTNTKEVLEKINELSNGDYFKNLGRWESGLETGSRDWGAKKAMEKQYEQHVAQARELSGERDLDKIDYYTITSQTDPNYNDSKKLQHPLRVTRYLPSLGKEKIPGEYEVHYAQYSYLEFPHPLQNGNTYTIKLNNGKQTSFLYNELNTISRAIKVNQAGYLPDCSQKYAYLGCYLQELGPMDFSYAKEYSVISADTGQTVLKGEIKLRSQNQRVAPTPGKTEDPLSKPFLTGEDTFEIDLNGLTQEGTFFITIPEVGRSWPFRHSHDVYGEAFYTAIRGLYHQRCGIAIEEPYSAWLRQLCHTDPVYESESIPFVAPLEAPAGYDVFDVIGATIDLQKPTNDARGGWHDAADWDKNISHYTDVFDLLYAYELQPHKFYTAQLNLPESGNGIPDILNEAEYGLRVWKKSMTDTGGVAGVLETWTHPPIYDPEFKYAYSKRTRWSSLLYAAAAAQLASLVRPFNEKLYESYSKDALEAFNFGNNPANSLGKITIHAAHERGQGTKYTLEWTEKDDSIIPFLIQAKLRLFILSDDKNYLENIPELMQKAPKPYVWPFTYRDFSPWLYYSIFLDKVTKELPLTFVLQWQKHYIEEAEELYKLCAQQPYRQSWPNFRDFWMEWGSTTMTNQARVLLIAYHLTQNKKYRDAAIVNLDYMLGANPMGMSWTTGIGHVYPIEIQHWVSEWDGIPDPVPGITIFGNTDGMFRELKNMVWESPSSNGPVKFMAEANWNVPLLRRWSCHPTLNTSQCEFTVYETMSSTIFTTAMLLPDGWLPSEDLKQKKPRKPESLFGYWYLP